MTKVSSIIAEITTASEEQATGIGEINNAISQMDEMTQQNSAMVKEVAAASKSMGAQAASLDDLVKFFTLKQQNREEGPQQAESNTALAGTG